MSEIPQVHYKFEGENMPFQFVSLKIKQLGSKLNLSMYVTNVAILYMHRFYQLNSFIKYNMLDTIVMATLLLASKNGEDQTFQLETMMKEINFCPYKKCSLLDDRYFSRPHPSMLDDQSEVYKAKRNEVILFENHLRFSIGYDTLEAIPPHLYVKFICNSVKANELLTRAALFMTDLSITLTSLITSYGSIQIACASFHLACKWSDYAVTPSNEGQEWFLHVDSSLTLKYLEDLCGKLLDMIIDAGIKFEILIIGEEEDEKTSTRIPVAVHRLIKSRGKYP